MLVPWSGRPGCEVDDTDNRLLDGSALTFQVFSEYLGELLRCLRLCLLDHRHDHGPSLDPLYDLLGSPVLFASTAGPRAERGHSVGVTGLQTDSFVDENSNPLEADPGLGHRPDGDGRDRMVDRDAISGA